MSLYKRIGCLTVVLALFSVLILSFPIPVSAAPAWTNAWTVIGSAESGGPANPFGIAADWEGGVYVTNRDEIKKLAKGSSSWETVINTGLSAAPDGIAVDKNGKLYITDSSSSVVQHLDSAEAKWKDIGGHYTTVVWVPERWIVYDGRTIWAEGYWKTSGENSGGIYFPYGVAVDEDLNVYVANPGDINYAEYYNSLAMLKEGEWSILGASYGGKVPCNIADVATDNSGNVYVTTQHSSGTNIGQDSIIKLSDGVWSTIERTHTNNPINPGSIAVDDSGYIYVVSEGDRTVKVYSEGRWTSISGSGIGGPQYPKKIAVDGEGNIYVTDHINKLIWRQQAPATQLFWLTPPTDGVAGRTWENPPRVGLMDRTGSAEKNVSNHTVTLTIDSSNGAALSGATATLQNGIATFSNLVVNKAGNGYTLTPSCSLSPNLAVYNSSAFNMAAPALPQVTGISPAKGIGGTEVTITGTNLTAASLVKFGDVAGVNLVVESDTSIKVTAPTQGAGPVNVRVTTPGGESATYGQFTYNQPGVWTGAWTIVEGPAGGFSNPRGLAIDNNDNIYVVNSGNNDLKKLGGGSWTTPVSGLNNPRGVAVDSSGNTYVADTNNKRIMKNNSIMDSWVDKSPSGVAVDKSNNVYVFLRTSSGGEVHKWNGTAWSDITYDGGFNYPQDIAVDSYGNVYVVDSGLNLAKRLPTGTENWETIDSGFSYLEGIFVDVSGNVYVADDNNVRELRVGSTEWKSIGGGLGYPNDVALDSQGNIYVSVSTGTGNYLYKHNAPATQLVWDTQPGDGPAGQALMSYPRLSLKDAKGKIIEGENGLKVSLSLYSDNGATLEGTTEVRMVNGTADFVDLKISKPGSGYRLVPSCSLSDIAIFDSESFDISDAVAPTPPLAWTGGWTTIGKPGNGFEYTSGISGITVDDDSNVYAVDRNNKNIKKFNKVNWDTMEIALPENSYGIALHGSDVYTAGLNNKNVSKNGIPFENSPSGAWSNFMPYDVTVDVLGNIYTVGTGSEMKVLKYDGSIWSSIDYNESFSYPKGIAVDDKGNVYVADSNNQNIKMLPADTKQWIPIGTGFNSPEGITVDNSGNVYVADVGAGGAIKVLTAGSSQWTSIPTAGTSGVNDVAVDEFGNVYVSYNNYVYRHQASAAKLVWETQPGGGIGRTVWSQQPVVSLKDAKGNIVTGDSSSTVTVTLNPANGATLDGTTDTATTTLNQGVASFSGLKVDKPGTYTLTLSNSLSNDSIECPESASFEITAGPVDSAQSEVIAGKTDVIADNSDSAAITVTLKDEYGNPVSGKTMELAQGSGSSVISPVDSITDDGGNVVFWVKSTKAETVIYTAKDITDNLIIAQTAQISFKAGAVDDGQSTVEADKTVVTADNSDSADITVTLKDAYGNPVGGKTVILSQEEGGSDISPSSGVSDSAGKVTFTVKSTKAETISYTATGDSVTLTGFQLTFKAGPAKEFIVDASGTQSAGTPFDVTVTVKDQYGNTVTDYTGTVSFSTDNGNSPGGWAPVLPENYSFTLADAGIHSFSSGATLYNASISVLTVVDRDDSSITGEKEEITVSAGTADTGTTTAASSESTVTANGSDGSTITVTVKDSYGNPISGKTVVLEKDSGSSVVTTVLGTSQADGTAVFVVKNTRAEIVTYTVKVDGTTQDVTAAIDFIPGPAEKLNITAAGAQTAGIPFNVTVTVWDRYENIVTGYTGTIQLNSTDAKGVLPGSHTFLETDNGTYTFSGIILKTVGLHKVTAVDMDNGSITGTTGDIDVAAGNEYAAKSTVAVGKSVVTADGIDSTMITVTLKDDYDNLINNKAVTLSQGEGGSMVEAVYGTTRTDGTAVFTVMNTKAEQVTYTAKVNGAAINQTVEVTFIPGPAESLILSAVGTQKAGEPFNVTVTAKDRYDNTAAGYRGTVQLISTDVNAVLPVSHIFAEADNGTYTFSGVILKTAGVQTVTAIDSINNSITGTTGNITVAADSCYYELSTIVADKSTVTANGKDNTSITVKLKDYYGNPINGKTVILSQGGGGSVVEAVYGTTRIDGTAVFCVTGTKAEKVSYMAMVDEKAATGFVEVTFMPGAAARLEWKIQPGGGAAGQIWPQQPVLVLKDSYGNVNTEDNSSEVTVELKYSTGAILGGSKTVTLKNGEAVFNNLRIDRKGNYKLTPKIDMEGIDSTDSNAFRISLVPAPDFEPNGGEFSGPIEVSIEYPEEYKAYYSLDGKVPTQGSILYSRPFSIFSNSTVTAAVYDEVYGEWSAASTAEFFIRLPAPSADIKDGSIIENNSTVTLSTTVQGADIYYTTDGSAPNTSSSNGNTVKITGAGGDMVTLKAYAVKAGFKESQVAEFKYIIRQTAAKNEDDDNGSGRRESSSGSSSFQQVNVPVPSTTVSGGSIVIGDQRLDSSTGKATATVNSDILESAFSSAQESPEGMRTVELNIPGVQGASAYEPTLPASYLSSGTSGTEISIRTDIATVTVPGNMLTAENAAGAQNISLTIASVDKTTLDEGVRAQIGSRPIIELNLSIDGKRASWVNEAAPVTVSIPYVPTAEELADPEHITVWYIDGAGNVLSVPSGRYDLTTGMVTFTTTHFSRYAAAFVRKGFIDIESCSWAKKQIEVLAAKGIMEGRTEKGFVPQAAITRAEYIGSLVRTLGVTAKAESNFNDIAADNDYYKEIAIAKKLGITNGIGNNRFDPESAITRQDMLVLTERALRNMKRISAAGTAADIEKFADSSELPGYAVGSIAALVRERLVEGSNGRLNAKSDTTRAEAAAFLYRIYNLK